MDTYDFILVGGGLAGCCLAWELYRQNKKIVVIAEEENRSTLVAAGLFNPITGKMLSKTWQAEKLFPRLNQFYKEIEKQTHASFFVEQPLYRPFISIEEQNTWMALTEDPGIKPFIQQIYLGTGGYAGVKDNFGGIVVKQAGFIRTETFVKATKDFFISINAWKTEKLNYDKITFTNNNTHVSYKELEADKIIFCEGVNSLKNPWLGWVPIKPLKGETLTIETDITNQVLVNRGVYAVPQLFRGTFKIGATYDHQITKEITEKGKIELCEKWENICKAPYRILAQDWGIRPTSTDRKPIIGLHPENKTIGIFNGLGTKGVTLAPYAAKVFTDFLFGKQPDQTYDAMALNRYYSLYWKSVNKA
jgi:glycine oxidase